MTILNEKSKQDFLDYEVPTSTPILRLYWDVRDDRLSLKPPAFVSMLP